MLKNVLPFMMLLLPGLALFGQAKKGKPATDGKPKTEAPKVVRNLVPMVTFGNCNYTGGNIKKHVFDSLAHFPLSSKDSMGNVYRVIGFDFTYGERNLYEDSVANLMVVTDYLHEYCPGDTLSAGITATLFDRTKPGDTVFIEKVKVVRKVGETFLPDSTAILGRSFKCVIIK
jgi:hypothetical protein